LPMTPAPLPASASSLSAVQATGAFPDTPDSPATTLAREHRLLIWPWLLAALAVAAAAALLFWRNRSRAAFAGGPQIDLFSPPAPVPPQTRPRPAPAPPVGTAQPAPQPSPSGIVSSSLRPWIEIGMQPLRCIVTDETVTIEFELDLFNSGSAPARGVFAEAVVINAGATQDQELASFFARAVGEGERIDVIHPLKRLTFTTQVVTPREHVRPMEMGGRQVFVPLVAFNAVYRWGSKEGRTSLSYLVGRQGTGEKLAPFRLDLGPRVFRGLGIRPLPAAVRK
jgi:hypothetical protein